MNGQDPKNFGSTQSPPGAIQVGFRGMYEDAVGGLHATPGQAVGETQRRESDLSRGTGGGCGQDPSQVPDPRR